MKRKHVRSVRHVHKSVWKKTVNPVVAWGAIIVATLVSVFALWPNMLLSQGNVEGTSTGFDQYGYNRNARVFNGPADGVDKNLDGTVWGDPTYAKDKLVMKWNSEWDRGNAEDWSKPPYNAWEDNEWNGKAPGGSGQTWHYKIVWVGNYSENPSLVPTGGYGIWGQFAVIMDQGQDPNYGPGHLWFAHANPTGYGAFKFNQ